MKKLGLAFCLAGLCVACFTLAAHAQTATPPNWKTEFYGFIRTDSFWDSRQAIAPWEGYINLYPAAVKEDAQGQDSNAFPALTAIAAFSRLGLRVQAPQWGEAQVSGLLELDYFGDLNASLNSNPLMRHAFIQLKWSQWEFLLGQTWDALTLNDVYPGVLSYSAARPLQPAARRPSVQAIWFPTEKLKIQAIASLQRDPFNIETIAHVSNLPEAAVYASYLDEQKQAGLGVFAKAIQPQANADLMYSGALQAFAKIQLFPELKLQARTIWGQNLDDHMLLGGYAQTTEGQFVPLGSYSAWFEAEYRPWPEWQLGLFMGWASSLGASGAYNKKEVFGLNANIAQALHLMPRVVYRPNSHLQFALEADYSAASYASGINAHLQPTVQGNDSHVGAWRLQFISMLFF